MTSFRLFLFPALLALILAACSTAPVIEPIPTVQPTLPPVAIKVPPRIGLALGGGAARGFAHVGVIQVLEELSQGDSQPLVDSSGARPSAN